MVIYHPHSCGKEAKTVALRVFASYNQDSGVMQGQSLSLTSENEVLRLDGEGDGIFLRVIKEKNITTILYSNKSELTILRTRFTRNTANDHTGGNNLINCVDDINLLRIDASTLGVVVMVTC